MVVAAIDKDDAKNPDALEELCKIYWKPVYLFIRSRGHSPTESEDLAQEFFYRLLAKEFLNRVEGSEKGRMRSFLCVLLKRFLADEYDKIMAVKRGGNWQAIPIDGPAAEALIAQACPDNQSPDLLFDRQWALDLLAQTLKILRQDYIAAGRAELFEKLKPTISLQFESPSYHELAEELGLTVGALKVAVHRFRKRYRDCLQATLRETLETPEEADQELRYLLSLFSS